VARHEIIPKCEEPEHPIKKSEDIGKLLEDFNQRTDQFAFIKDHFVVWRGLSIFRKSEGIYRSLAFDGLEYSGSSRDKEKVIDLRDTLEVMKLIAIRNKKPLQFKHMTLL
jgi:hypothetical protein